MAGEFTLPLYIVVIRTCEDLRSPKPLFGGASVFDVPSPPQPEYPLLYHLFPSVEPATPSCEIVPVLRVTPEREHVILGGGFAFQLLFEDDRMAGPESSVLTITWRQGTQQVGEQWAELGYSMAYKIIKTYLLSPCKHPR